MMDKAPEMTAMSLYVMQHGHATSDAENPERPLTDAGRAAVQRAATRARAAGRAGQPLRAQRKLRAGADRAAASRRNRRAGQRPGSCEPGAERPGAPTAHWLRGVSEHQALALVGHLPFLYRLASLLLADNEDVQVVHFRMGLVKLEPKQDRDGFAVAWAIPPDLA